MLYTLIMVFIAILCVVLIIVILLQAGQGSGLSGGLAGNTGMGGSGMVGARRTADFLSKSTSVLGAVFLTLCLLANFVIDREEHQGSTIQRGAADLPIMERHDLPTDPSDTAPAIPLDPEPADDQDD